MKTKIVKINLKHPQISKISQAAVVIKTGNLVAIPTETVYGIGANALDAKAVKKIFKAKGRPLDNPLIIHISKFEEMDILVDKIPDSAKKLMKKFWPGPLTIVLKKSKTVPKITTGGLNTVAIRMPDNQIARQLIKESGVPIAAPSANISGKPSPTIAAHVKEDLYGKIPMIIDGGKTKIGIESTVIDLSGKTPILLRPGGVTLEQLEKSIGKIKVHSIKRKEGQNSVSRSPGMKYRHYSPKAKIILIKGPKNKANEKIKDLLAQFKKQGKKVGVLSTDKDWNFSREVMFIGKRFDEVASNLFQTFREFDSRKVEIILIHGIGQKGLGLGIMDRIEKAAVEKINV